jgi:hypothetical protein
VRRSHGSSQAVRAFKELASIVQAREAETPMRRLVEPRKRRHRGSYPALQNGP